MDSFWSGTSWFFAWGISVPSSFEKGRSPGVWYIECHTQNTLQIFSILFHDAEHGSMIHPEQSVEYATKWLPDPALKSLLHCNRKIATAEPEAQGLGPSGSTVSDRRNEAGFYLRPRISQP
jgi:hypothetical protein